MVYKKIIPFLILALVFASNGFTATTAKQVDFLAAGIEKDGDPCSGCKVYTYETGTTTAKATYLDRNKGSSAANPVVLDSEGRAEIFADGLYKMVIKTAADASYFDIDGLDYGAGSINFTTLSSYSDLEEAIADIGATETVLIMDTTTTLNSNLTIPTNVTLHVFQYDSVDLNGKILTMNGAIVAPPIEWIAGSSGTFTGSPIVQFYDPTWTVSTVTDSATPSYKSLSFGNPVVTGTLTVGGASTFYNTVSIQNTSTFYNTAIFNTTTTFNDKATFANTVVWNKGSDISIVNDVSLDLSNDGNYFDIVNTGVANIIGIESEGVGTIIKLHFDADVTLINSTDLELIGAANITTAADDEVEFIEYASGDWRMTKYNTLIDGQVTTAKLADNAVTTAKMINTTTEVLNQAISASSTWLPDAGTWINGWTFIGGGVTVITERQVNSVWAQFTNEFFMADGVNYRFRETGGNPGFIHYRKLD